MRERLDEEVVGASLHRLDSSLNRTERGENDNRYCRLCAADVMEQFDTVHPRHLQISDDGLNAGGRILQLGSCVDSIRRSLNGMPFVTQCGFESRQHLDIII